MQLRVQAVRIPPFSTLGYGLGVDDDGATWEFVGDHRPMRELGEEVIYANADGAGDQPVVELEDYQLLGQFHADGSTPEGLAEWRVEADAE